MAAIMYFWGQSGEHPLEMAYCALDKNAPACPGPDIKEHISGLWRVEGGGCPGDIIVNIHKDEMTVKISDVVFEEEIEKSGRDYIESVIVAPKSNRNQRFRFEMKSNPNVISVNPIYGGRIERWEKC